MVKKINWLVFGILCVFALIAGMSLHYQNYWSAETEHSCAGYIYLTTGHTFNLATHGIITGALSALPLMFIHVDHPVWETVPNIKKYCEFEFASYGNNSPELILILTKIPMILIGLLGGIYVYKWSKDLFGEEAGIFSLVLYCFSPLVLGYSRTTNLDITTAVFFFITLYYFWRYYKFNKGRDILWMGFFLGLTCLTKPSVFVIFPVFLIIGLIMVFKKKWKFWDFISLMIITCIIGFVIFLLPYSFEWHPIYNSNDMLYMNATDYRSEDKLDGIISKFPVWSQKDAKWFLTEVPVPAPHYWQGFYPLFSYLSSGNSGAGNGYFKGYDNNTGSFTKWIWTILLKTPISLMILFLIALVIITIKKQWEVDYLFLFLPAVLYTLEFMISNMLGGIRLLLPVFLLIFVFCGTLIGRGKTLSAVIVCLTVWYILATLFIYPSFDQYYNEFIGGSVNGPNYFINSDIDAKQDFRMLDVWMEKNNINWIYLNTTQYAPSDKYKRFDYVPFSAEDKNITGYVAISISSLYGETYKNKDDFSWLRELEPIPEMKYYGYSMRVYKI